MSSALKAQVAIDYAFESHPFTHTPRSVRQRWAEAKLNKTKLHILNHILERQCFEKAGAHIYIDTLARLACVSYDRAQKNLKALQKDGWVELLGKPMMGYYMRLSLPEADTKIVLETAPRKALSKNDLQRTRVGDNVEYNNTPKTPYGVYGRNNVSKKGKGAPVRLAAPPVGVPSEYEKARDERDKTFSEPLEEDLASLKGGRWPEQRESLIRDRERLRSEMKLAKRDDSVENIFLRVELCKVVSRLKRMDEFVLTEERSNARKES